METNPLWKAGFGRVATRAAQTLLILTLVSVLVVALAKLSLVVVPVILATILASAIFPLVTFMERVRVNRATGSLLTIMVFLSLLGGAGFFIVSSVKTQWATLSKSITQGFEQIAAWLHSGHLPVPVEQIDEAINESQNYLTSSSFGQGALQVSGDLASAFAGFILTIVILFFFLKDGDKIFSFLIGFLNKDIRGKAQEAGGKAASVLGGYIRGTTIVALVDVVLIGIGLAIMGVPLVIPLCLLVFIGAYIPYIGATSAGVVASLVALVSNGFESAVIVALIVLLVNQVEGHVLAPFILGNALKISPLAIVLALSVGAILGGIVGTLLAVPVVAVLWVVWTTWQEVPEEKPDGLEDEQEPADDEPSETNN